MIIWCFPLLTASSMSDYKGLINISSPDEVTSHTRHFYSVESIITDQKDDKHFFIQYNDSKPIAQCYAMTSSEGSIIRDILTDIIDRERIPTEVSNIDLTIMTPSSYLPLTWLLVMNRNEVS
jgi:hypothetical protein